MDFIEKAVAESAAQGQKIITRYPPEPNGYMHIGHAKAFYIDWHLAKKYGGFTNLRFDDTNPEKEDMEYVDAMKQDITWLGLDYEQVLFASDYYEQLYKMAQVLINKGLAYVDFSTPEQIKKDRGGLGIKGKDSPYRNTDVKTNLAEFKNMRDGKYPDGHCVLRAKIDMSSGNMNMRDPVIYRILRVPHYRTGDAWIIYPLYDFAHPLSDAIENISHSICSLEYEDHRPLYDWFIEHAWEGKSRPRQFEFSRLNIEQTVMSKRFLKKLVEDGVVDGWDDPRMPTISGMRRRGYPPVAVLDFVASTGVSKNPMTVPLSALEFYIRAHLDKAAPRLSVVFDPIKIKVGKKEFYIEKDDFSKSPPPGFKRLTPGGVVRLRELVNVKCVGVHEDYLECVETEEKQRGVIHWVDVSTAVPVTVNEFKPLLFTGTALADDNINHNSKKTTTAFAEPKILDTKETFQAIRKGFYIRDAKEKGERITLLKTVDLKSGF